MRMPTKDQRPGTGDPILSVQRLGAASGALSFRPDPSGLPRICPTR